MNIVFFGDSLTQGTFGISFVDKVKAALPRHHFLNKGISGDTTLNLYRRIKPDVIDLKPDGVFIMVGSNDATSFAQDGMHLFFRYAKGIPGGQLSPIAVRENMRAILSSLTAAGIRAWVALEPIEYNPALVAAQRKVNAAISEVCAEMKIPTLDVMAKLTPSTVPDRPPLALLSSIGRNSMTMLTGHSAYNRLRDSRGFTYTFDGIHLTEDGAQRIADLIVPFLRSNGVP